MNAVMDDFRGIGRVPKTVAGCKIKSYIELTEALQGQYIICVQNN
jgi:hypothetical protein